MKVIGVSGYARAGKDTFASIAIDILKQNGFEAKQYSFAGALKEEVKDFLQKNCGVDVYTQDGELKKDIRDFLVWYGTTFWRKRDPKRWIRGVDLQIKSDGNNADGIVKPKIDIAIISDVRYLNEAEWIHSWGGYLVHIAAYKWQDGSIDFKHTNIPDGKVKVFFDAPNEQEKINDPLVNAQSDIKVEWEIKGLAPKKAFCDPELRAYVRNALNSMEWFTYALRQ